MATSRLERSLFMISLADETIPFTPQPARGGVKFGRDGQSGTAGEKILWALPGLQKGEVPERNEAKLAWRRKRRKKARGTKVTSARILAGSWLPHYRPAPLFLWSASRMQQ
jgi:hypothetical protein